MYGETGLDPRQPGYTWGDYVDALVADAGSLAAVALKVAQHASPALDAQSVERGLRRLRGRGTRDGGEHGVRLLRVYGLPRSVEARLRWLGMFHSRSADLPSELLRDLLNIWSRPPASDSADRVWLALGYAQLAVRQRDYAEAHARLAEVPVTAAAAARLERALVFAYVEDRLDSFQSKTYALEEATDLVGALDPADPERPNYAARLADQLAHEHLRCGELEPARELYEGIAAVTPYAACRRALGLAYVLGRCGAQAEALAMARAASRHAGDGGFVRLRAVSLGLLAHLKGASPRSALRRRAAAIARRLDDAELDARLAR
ncbi:MAG TPA: hypothetical protein PLR99_12805 [Polyangiaceae bacterium]|jgi:hypothetical protein|nr:hypothetical protein [Polyangiaceae bacterium]